MDPWKLPSVLICNVNHVHLRFYLTVLHRNCAWFIELVKAPADTGIILLSPTHLFMPAARAEPSCITAHPAHDPLATSHRLQGETYLWSIQMSPFSSRWVGGWWRCEQCSGAALGLRLRCITIGLTWESYSTISHPCTPYTWLFNAPTRHTATHLTQFENFIHCESVKHLDSSAPPHLAREFMF